MSNTKLGNLLVNQSLANAARRTKAEALGLQQFVYDESNDLFGPNVVAERDAFVKEYAAGVPRGVPKSTSTGAAIADHPKGSVVQITNSNGAQYYIVVGEPDAAEVVMMYADGREVTMKRNQ